MINMDLFWKSTARGDHLKLYSPEHIIALSLILGIIIFMFISKDKLSTIETKRKVGRILACVLFLQTFFLHFWFFDSGTFSLQESLPLYLCRITSILCIFMILKENFSFFEIIYFWGLGGATQALLTPDTGGFQFPHWIYIQFFIAHGGILISIFFMMIAYEYKPNLNSLKRTFKYSYVYLFIVFIINYLVGGNYSYLRTKPLTPTVLDYLPIYPYYIPIMVIGMFLIFFVLYIPFIKTDVMGKKSNKSTDN
ncbi:TIGR02206 family membrane protein [Oceanirhabdus seepicola]|uniref:TIGR02206 family membrane protein n=1 Tax=Oceanirhabdus seepicola TaxID=2828781 RepID=A0A9J6P6M4_9CLOT|nr:TIGR02206 family membrane protein [Oceanirhabdus seepicola]MCM1992243.1 TIGR02206 family membrane protein [Oceanirhabdus seepicola]